jgi:serine/threonine-protein kinase RsbW
MTGSEGEAEPVYDRGGPGNHHATAERRNMDPLGGRIELSLPPDSRYMRLARLMASGVATTCGLPLEEVEDFRIAVDELCATLIEIGDGQPVRLCFELGGDALEVVATTTAGRGEAIDEERLALSRQILDVVTDGHDLAQAGGQVSFSARKVVRGRGVG